MAVIHLAAINLTAACAWRTQPNIAGRSIKIFVSKLLSTTEAIEQITCKTKTMRKTASKITWNFIKMLQMSDIFSKRTI
jgi:hypothetical protein